MTTEPIGPDDLGIGHLAEELDQSSIEWRIHEESRRAARLSALCGVDVDTNFLGIEIPADATKHVTEDFWPNGEPLVIYTYWA